MPPNRNSKHHHHVRPDWLVESFIGQLVYRVAKPSWYPEEKDDFEVPDKYKSGNSRKGSPASTLVDRDDLPQAKEKSNGGGVGNGDYDLPPAIVDPEDPSLGRMTDVDLERNEKPRPKRNDSSVSRRSAPQQSGSAEKSEKQSDDQDSKQKDNSPEEMERELQKTAKEKGYIVVDWYNDDDPANPSNWSLLKKNLFTFEICFLTISIYMGSAIYSPGYQSIEAEFGISTVVASLGLTLFNKFPSFFDAICSFNIGRNPPYIITLFIFVCLQVPCALAPNITCLLICRFLAGFIGSPVLATGGASLGDVYGTKTRPYAIAIWGITAICGPVLGPLIGGFAAQEKDWRWTFWIMLWLSGFACLVLAFIMPETSSSNILTRRAQRLRKLTGNDKIRSPGEIQGEGMGLKSIAKMTLWMPFFLSFHEPILLAVNLYIGLIYSILYCFIESFALVFVQVYGFNLGLNGVAFMGLFIGGLITLAGYCLWIAKSLNPKIRRQNGVLHPEQRMPTAILGAFCLPICLFWFGWTSQASIHWIVPIIGSSFFTVGAFLIFGAILNYLSDAYPSQAASVLAGNDFFRSMMGGSFPLFSSIMFMNLGGGGGVAWGCTLLGCLTILFIPIPFYLLYRGKALRMKSKYARHDI